MDDQVKNPVCVAVDEKSPAQARHDAIYKWAVDEENLGGSSGNARANLDNFRALWERRMFEDCYGKLMAYLGSVDDIHAVLDTANEWKIWIASIRSGEFTPA
jgi:hypothetical protein